MDFRRELEHLLRQIPEGSVARCADVARALGDATASLSVFRFLGEHPEVPGASRVLSGTGGSAAKTRFFTDFVGDRPLEKLRAEQLEIASRVSSRDAIKTIHTIGGADVSYGDDRGFASAIVLRGSDLIVTDESLATRTVHFPYIPTYLAAREVPLIEYAVDRLGERPDVLLVDGHGRLHPRRSGLACAVGVKLDMPTIGVAKNPMRGSTWRRPAIGASEPVRIDGEVLGYAFRTSASRRPIFVSVGHRVSLRSAIRIVRLVSRGKIPEPLRRAHVAATEFKRRKGKKDRKMVKTRSIHERKSEAKEESD